MNRFLNWVGVVSLLGSAGCGGGGVGGPDRHANAPVAVPASAPRPAPRFETDVAPMIGRYCLPCHDASTRSGGIALEADDESDDEAVPSLATWGRVADALRAGTMPPIGRDRPSPAEEAAIQAWLDAEVLRRSTSELEAGRVTMRRLNRAEYDATIRDLVGLDLRLAGAFPADDLGYGFDNNGDVLSIPPILMEKYLAAANLAIDAAARSPQAWAAIMNPSPDAVPPTHRKYVRPVRSEPVKRIGRPSPAEAAPVVEDPEAVSLRLAREVVRGFADRAYRRPATDEELSRLVALVESARRDGDSLDEAIQYALKAVLISPWFLFHVETDDAGANRLIGEFELASRLSYFLWSSMPDDELYRLAALGELRKGDNLAATVRRMLVDPKSRALVDGFVAQWLQIRGLKEVAPDPRRFPEFDESLRAAMYEETARFSEAIIREDRGVLEFLVGDSTFVNERLARHYGISGVSGAWFRRVSLIGTPRRGVLTQASVLTSTSNPTRTSPVARGKWVLDNVLGAPPAPPPQGVEALKAAEGAAAGETLRRRMERHRDRPECASCHARMDPLGFSLENFDAVGAWRTHDEGAAIDASGAIPGVATFEGAAGLRAFLTTRRDAFARCFAEKLLTYAIGRGPVAADRCVVDELVRRLKRGDDRFSALVLAIVESRAFQGRSPRSEKS